MQAFQVCTHTHTHTHTHTQTERHTHAHTPTHDAHIHPLLISILQQVLDTERQSQLTADELKKYLMEEGQCTLAMFDGAHIAVCII